MDSSADILILGSTGSVGAYLLKALRGKFRVVGASRKGHESDAAFDLSGDPAHWCSILTDCRYLIFAIGTGGNKAVSANFQQDYDTLVGGFERLLIFLSSLKRPPTLVHLSSSCVFPMSSGFVVPDTPIRPVNAYGLLKANQEAMIHSLYRNAIIMRIGTFINAQKFPDLNPSLYPNLLSVPEKLFTPTYSCDLAESLCRTVSHGETVTRPIERHVVSDICVNYASEGCFGAIPFSKDLNTCLQTADKANLFPSRTLRAVGI